MQDGGDSVAQGSNKVHYPQRARLSCCQKVGALTKLKELQQPSEDDQILSNNPCINTVTRSCKISKVFSLKAIKKTAKAHDSSINELFLGVINKSLHDFTKAKGKS